MITCWLFQRIVSSRVDANTVLPVWAQNHLHNCSACRGIYESARTLVQQLSASADAQRQSPGPFLHGKIMSEVRSQHNAEPQRGHWRLGWGMGLGTACLIAAVIVWLRQPPAPDPSASGSTSSYAELALNVNLPTVAQVDEWTKTPDAPLQEET